VFVRWAWLADGRIFKRLCRAVADGDLAEAIPLIATISPRQITTDVYAVLEHLHAIAGIEVDCTAIIGFCSTRRRGRAHVYTRAPLISLQGNDIRDSSSRTSLKRRPAGRQGRPAGENSS
jgi:hypothetical protein